MIRIEDLATMYNELLGDSYFDLAVNTNIDYMQSKTQAVIYATRRPFAIPNLDAETIELAFEFYINVDNPNTMYDMLNAINNINGLKEGSFDSNDNTYTYTSFLTFPRPLSAPQADTGSLMQVVQLTGTVFISNSISGIKMGNDVRTYLTIDETREEVFVSSSNIANTRESDAPTKLNQNQAQTKAKTQSVIRTLNIYDMRSTFCDNLEKIIEASDSGELNLPVTLERVYPTHTVTVESVITSGTIVENKGAFMTINLTLQKR